jgi:lysophospholipase L1-like esterase
MRQLIRRLLLGAALALAGVPASAVADQSDEERLHTDWAQLGHYREVNRRLPPPDAARPRVVFMGDSITESWNLADLGLAQLEVLNRGLGGQTTPQMLVRFRQDVVRLKPAVVHILAGTNDLAGNTGATTLAAIEDNLAGMAEIAQANHIRVVLASVLPAIDYPWRPGLGPAPRIVALNAWMRAYAREHGLVYLDYHSAVADAHQGLRSGLSDDGVHPNAAGYAALNPLAREAILAALGQH